MERNQRSTFLAFLFTFLLLVILAAVCYFVFDAKISASVSPTPTHQPEFTLEPPSTKLPLFETPIEAHETAILTLTPMPDNGDSPTNTPTSAINGVPGKLRFDYPPHLYRQESQLVTLTISIAERSHLEVRRIVDRVNNAPTFNIYRAELQVPKSIQAKLTSQGFTIKALQPEQPIHFGAPDSNQAGAVDSVTWGWIIQAPNYDGGQVIVLSLYEEGAPTLLWVSSFTIDVSGTVLTSVDVPLTLTPTAPITETPTLIPPTPTPAAIERLVSGLVDNSAAIVIALIGIIVPLLALYFQYIWKPRRRHGKK